MSEFAIFTRELVKEFQTDKHVVRAVDQLSLQVAPGETYGLIGPDGAGKTTTTRVVLGLLNRSAGESKQQRRARRRQTAEVRGVCPPRQARPYYRGRHHGLS